MFISSLSFLEPTICPYGYVRTVVKGVKVSMGRKNKRPLLVEVAPTGVDHEIVKIETSGDDKPDILSPVNIENMVIKLTFCKFKGLNNHIWINLHYR